MGITVFLIFHVGDVYLVFKRIQTGIRNAYGIGDNKTADGLCAGIQLGKNKLDMENLFAIYCQFGLNIVSRIEMIVPYGQSW